MKNVVFLMSLMYCSLANASCEIEQYKKYLNSQSVSMLEATKTIFEEDKVAFKIIKPFVKFQVRYNKLDIYVAEKLNIIDPSLLNTGSTISKLVPRFSLKVTSSGSLENRVDLAMANDSFYTSEKAAMSADEDYYLFLKGMSSEEKKQFFAAREVLNSFVSKSSYFPNVQSAFSKQFSEVCNP
ncbi:hypothetical protein [Microbulbifer sp. GL-2]|uniref:hypothetical protein n=1 Tax=Microbulbifer sp. GL-2 TaxID=2591606 RepID=UPI00116268A5|nr:hypothetical protein [Microbulbifer sp. GL-2]BBM02425.1 hypothetical protein GL2_24990 [Microbulbifer sp. GL-2]